MFFVDFFLLNDYRVHSRGAICETIDRGGVLLSGGGCTKFSPSLALITTLQTLISITRHGHTCPKHRRMRPNPIKILPTWLLGLALTTMLLRTRSNPTIRYYIRTYYYGPTTTNASADFNPIFLISTMTPIFVLVALLAPFSPHRLPAIQPVEGISPIDAPFGSRRERRLHRG